MVRIMCCCAAIVAILISLGLSEELWPDDDTGEYPTEDRYQLPIQNAEQSGRPAGETGSETPAGSVPAEMRPENESGASADGQQSSTDSPGSPADGSDPAPAGDAVNEPEPEPELTPLFVRALTPIRPGRNDSNPTWSPDGRLVAFERAIGDNRELIVANRNGAIVRTIYLEPKQTRQNLSFFFPGVTDTASYSAGLCWSPDGQSLAFMSNAGSGNYDLYLLPDLLDFKTVRLTRTPEKDSHPDWSPTGTHLLFVSGRHR